MENVFAIVKNNIVINMIVADDVETAEMLYPESLCIDVSNFDVSPGIGDSYSDGEFTSTKKTEETNDQEPV